MNSNIRFIHSENIVNALQRLECNETPFAEVSSNDFELTYIEIQPPEGYTIPKNDATGEQFPNCCEYHRGVLKSALVWFEKFPNCCEPHKKLLTAPWFNKLNYQGMPLKVTNQLSY